MTQRGEIANYENDTRVGLSLSNQWKPYLYLTNQTIFGLFFLYKNTYMIPGKILDIWQYDIILYYKVEKVKALFEFF